jgi:NAD(P)-dependent dehydrogenase (short-subunit alcohol dehydrogenase family)
MTRGLAIELGRVNIRVNAVCPGAVDTPLHRRHVADGREDTGVSVDDLVVAFSRQSVSGAHTRTDTAQIVGRVGQPKEIGEAVYFLADEKRSSFVTGTSLTVDGGLLAILCS